MHKSKDDILDPKLKEAYERVMNTKVHIQDGGVPDAPPPPKAKEKDHDNPFMMVNEVKEPHKQHVSDKKGLPLPLIMIGIVLFAGVYTVVCAMIIGVKIPFLPF